MNVETTECAVKNVKIRFCLSPSISNQIIERINYWKAACETKPSYFICTKLPNYIVFKNTLVYTIFTDLNHTYFKINITGIPTVAKIEESVKTFCQHFNVSEKDIISSIFQDSIFACGRYGTTINLRMLQRLINSNKKCNFRVKFNCETAAAAYCRHKHYGTIALFRTGKYLILGSKCENQIKQILEEMNAIIRML
jgi:TATA-box binding protein (TBP) (component of TFIID and TFIIIB)